MNQELINLIASEMRKGSNYVDIHKSLMNSDYKIKEINLALRLIRIVGLENVDENLVMNLKGDKLFRKNKSELAKYFNISIFILVLSIVIKVISLFSIISSNNINLLFIIFITINLILLSFTIVGLYYASDWGLGLFMIVAISTFLGTWNQLYEVIFEAGFNYFFLSDIIMLIIISFCFFKIMKKFSWKVP